MKKVFYILIISILLISAACSEGTTPEQQNDSNEISGGGISDAGISGGGGSGAATLPVLNISHLPQFPEGGDIGGIRGVEKLRLDDVEGMVYSVKAYGFDEKKSLAFAQTYIGDKDLTVDRKFPGATYLSKDGQMIEVDEVTGSFQYLSKEYADMTYDDEITNRLSDEEYIKYSKDYMKKKNINFDSLDVTTPKVAPYMEAEVTDESGQDKKTVRLIGVFFHNKPLDNIVFEGVGPRLVFVFDNSGEIINVHSAWREFTRDKKYPLIDISGLQERISSGKFTYSGNVSGDIVVDKVEIVYIPEPVGIKQECIVPVYKLSGKDSANTKAFIYVQALKDKYFSESPAEDVMSDE